MSRYVSFLVISLFFVACNSDEEADDNVQIETTVGDYEADTTSQEPVNTISPGEYVEYHENGAIKIKGRNNENGNRTGLWTSYYDNGIKWSECYYIDGKKDGHSFTFYPNGKVRYRGEYQMDEKIGTWSFYDEAGNLTNEEKY